MNNVWMMISGVTMTSDDAFFDMLTTLPPSAKQLALIEQLCRHFGEETPVPFTREEAQLLLTSLLERRRDERQAG